jgi:hypothetical protein
MKHFKRYFNEGSKDLLQNEDIFGVLKKLRNNFKGTVKILFLFLEYIRILVFIRKNCGKFQQVQETKIFHIIFKYSPKKSFKQIFLRITKIFFKRSQKTVRVAQNDSRP